MFDELSEKLEAAFARLRGRGVLTEADIKEGLREVRRVLLEADVNFALTREFLERVEKKAVGVSQLKAVSPAQQLVKIVYDELTTMLGERREGLKLSSVPPTVVMMVGLQGSERRPPPRSSRGSSRPKAGRPGSLRPTSIVPPRSISWRPSASSSTSRCTPNVVSPMSYESPGPASTRHAVHAI